MNEVAEFNPKSELPDEFEYVDLESVVGTEMISHRTETKDSAPSRAQRLAQPGDVFFQTVRPYQKNNYLFSKLDNNYVFSTGYAQMRPNIDTAFLMSFLQTDSFVKIVLDNCTGTSYPAINSSDLSNLEISLPKSFEEQKKVGKTIISIDNLITLHQRKSFLYFSRINDWEQRKVSDVAKIIAGGTPSTKENSYWEPKEIPWLSSGEVHKKYITFTDDMISQIGMNNSSAKMVAKDSVLIALAGQGKTRGTVAINRIPLTTNQSIAAMTFNENFIPEFVFYNLENRYDELRRMSSGDGSRGGLNKQLVGDIEIPYTEKKEQERIGSFFESLDRIITLHRRAYYNKKGGLTNVHNDNQQYYAIL